MNEVYTSIFNAREAFSRNIGLLTPEEQEKLLQSCVALPGLGGVGGAYAEILARQGIGAFKLADFDVYELVNFNRQFGATLDTIGKPKLDIIDSRIRSINGDARIQNFPQGVSPENIDAFLDGVDVVLDCIDLFALDMRLMIYAKAYEKGIPVVSAAPLGFGATLEIAQPGKMSFGEFFDIETDMDFNEKLVRIMLGLAPLGLHVPYFDRRYISFPERRVPSSSIGISLCAAAATMEVLRLVLGWDGLAPLPYYHQFDLRRGIWQRKHLPLGNKSLSQRKKIKAFRKHFGLNP